MPAPRRARVALPRPCPSTQVSMALSLVLSFPITLWPMRQDIIGECGRPGWPRCPRKPSSPAGLPPLPGCHVCLPPRPLPFLPACRDPGRHLRRAPAVASRLLRADLSVAAAHLPAGHLHLLGLPSGAPPQRPSLPAEAAVLCVDFTASPALACECLSKRRCLLPRTLP